MNSAQAVIKSIAIVNQHFLVDAHQRSNFQHVVQKYCDNQFVHLRNVTQKRTSVIEKFMHTIETLQIPSSPFEMK